MVISVAEKTEWKYYVYSITLHIILFGALIISAEFQGEKFVVKNAEKNTDVINAVVMMESPSQSLLPVPIKKIIPKPVVSHVEKKAIIIPDKKQKKWHQEKIAQQLLADLRKETRDKRKLHQRRMEKELKLQAQKSLEQQLLKETTELAGQRTAFAQGEVNRYKALILQSISQQWLVPNNADKKLYSELLIRLAPGGMVIDVQVIKSSGDEALDRSARAAVFKSSPLPVPKDEKAFTSFRQFVLKMKPENIVQQQEMWVK